MFVHLKAWRDLFCNDNLLAVWMLLQSSSGLRKELCCKSGRRRRHGDTRCQWLQPDGPAQLED